LDLDEDETGDFDGDLDFDLQLLEVENQAGDAGVVAPARITSHLYMADTTDPDLEYSTRGGDFTSIQWDLEDNSIALRSPDSDLPFNNGSYAYPLDDNGSIKHVLAASIVAHRYAGPDIENEWDNYCKVEVKFYDDSNKTNQIGSTYTTAATLGGLSKTYVRVKRDNTGTLQTSYYVEAKLIDVSSSDVIDTATMTILLKGGADFDGDEDVDNDDYLTWQANNPTASGAGPEDGDADLDGDVDGADYLIWQAQQPCGGSGVPCCNK
jgi:hypothetical protein